MNWFAFFLIATMIGILFKRLYRKPDVVLMNKGGNIYLRRWYVIPHSAKWGFNVYLHNFMSSDEDRALHDHPWWNLSVLLWGKYLEHLPKNNDKWIKDSDRHEITKTRYPFMPIYRNPEAIHRVELFKKNDGTEYPVWTLFITGPKVREWGFWCPFGFRHNRKFLDPTGTKKGPGCD